MNTVYLYLLSPLHTGGTTQEGNLLGIARESHTNLPYIPSSTIRGKLRASVQDKTERFKLFGNELNDDTTTQLEQGNIWIGDGSILWLPVPSLSHGVIWISSPMLLRRWAKFNNTQLNIPSEYSCNFKKSASAIYLKDAMFKAEDLLDWENWKQFLPQNTETTSIQQLMVLPDRHCSTMIQMGLWRQVKIKLDQHKTVDSGFRYEEAIPPDTLMYFPWGITSQANGSGEQAFLDFQSLLQQSSIIQIGGQESLGRGFVQQWI
ncbi:type III-B CRISPR module RAMP protein Cmr4 [Crocosphaera sp. XPORK-15E]|uniref:type III-B CRISPR module RAMP protein Cmr4 n=1 Tax=Crocosphaera sp. XPORK-15E TaxID=3110247 RepID=UPI002B21C3B7|nr:type III-B CRISPR module RAMP protein Cmr4 [Crocosphaera sp. XPORK-15E]MEA5537021.1 type III-B CRISPR module RAMP protein Cmr4 [Crocosphaera sp. XPORK-15E]